MAGLSNKHALRIFPSDRHDSNGELVCCIKDGLEKRDHEVCFDKNEVRFPDYRKLLLTLREIAELGRENAVELFDYLFANPLRSVIHGSQGWDLIVFDVLGEAGKGAVCVSKCYRGILNACLTGLLRKAEMPSLWRSNLRR